MRLLLPILWGGLLWAAPQSADIKLLLKEPGAPLYATLAGKEVKVADAAQKAWLLNGGKQIAYSGRDGAGGFENEGESLRVFDPSTRKTRKVLSERFEIKKVESVRARNARTALLVTMEDGGLGATHIAVVDPARGEVWAQHGARFGSVTNGTIRVEWYRDEDWPLEGKPSVKPVRTQSFDLSTLLARPVIIHRPATGAKKQ